MDRRLTDVPRVPQRPRLKLEPEPDPDAPVALPPALEALLQNRHAERMRRAEIRSLVPSYISEVKRQLAAERAVEENLARGRVRLRREIRLASDLGRMGLDRHNVRFPREGCTTCEIFRPVAWGLGIVASPFLVYTALLTIVFL